MKDEYHHWTHMRTIIGAATLVIWIAFISSAIRLHNIKSGNGNNTASGQDNQPHIPASKFENPITEIHFQHFSFDAARQNPPAKI